MIHQWAPPERLAALRVAVFGIWFGRIATTPVTQYTKLPGELVEPTGLMRLLPVEWALSSPGLLVALKVAALVLCALCVVGARPWRPLAVAAVVLILLHDGGMKSIQGFVNHGQVAALYAAVILAVSPAADAWTFRRRGEPPRGEWRHGGPLLACSLLMAVAYSLIGIRRLVWGGAEVFTDGSVLRWVVGRTLQYAAYDFEVGLLVLRWPAAGAVLAVGMLVVTVLETLSPLALRYERFRLLWLAVIGPFHVATMFLMNIFFWENLLLLAVLFAPLRALGLGRPARVRALAGETSRDAAT